MMPYEVRPPLIKPLINTLFILLDVVCASVSINFVSIVVGSGGE